MTMDSLPTEVSMYLNSLSDPDRDYAFLRLDGCNLLISSGGALEKCGIPPLQLNSPIENQITQLSALLPIKEDAIVIQNTQIKQHSFIDIHLFRRCEFQWVMFFDNTEAALRLQADQQKRLSDDILQENEKKSKKI